MCGILGAVDVNAGGVVWWQDGLDLMVHRGPDSGGVFTEGPVVLGARRLRIHDLSDRADQPMYLSDGSFVTVFNGAIFNYRELRDELISEGCKFETTGDTEVLLQAVRTWGPSAFSRFDGMFAIACYDRKERRLLVARDKLGIKPLHLFRAAGMLLFSSEIKPLLCHPKVPRRLNRDALPEFLAFQQVMPPDTLFEGIEVLRAGHYLDIRIEATIDVREVCYWQIDAGFTRNSCGEDVEEALLASLRQCWDADRAVGIQLSGGVDSSLITALSVEKLGHGGAKTYSVFFDDSQIKYYLPRSEEPYIKQVCDKYGLDNYNYTFGADDVRPAFAEAIWHHEMPLNGASTCLYMLLARSIVDKVTVLITGEGADDIFLGYFAGWSFEEHLQSLFKMFVGADSIRSMFGERGLDLALFKRRDLACDSRLDGMTPIQKASVMTIDSVLHGLLARHDRMFMAHSIEGRPPFCSDRLVRARFTLPDDAVHYNGEGKVAVKRLAEKYFPQDFVRRKKIGFSAPFGDWCSDPRWWRGYVERLQTGELSELLDLAPVRAVLSMPEGKDKWSGQNLNLLFSLANFQLWYDIFIDSRDFRSEESWRQAVPETVALVS